MNSPVYANETTQSRILNFHSDKGENLRLILNALAAKNSALVARSFRKSFKNTLSDKIFEKINSRLDPEISVFIDPLEPGYSELDTKLDIHSREFIFRLSEALDKMRKTHSISGASSFCEEVRRMLAPLKLSLMTFNVCDVPSSSSAMPWCYDRERFAEIAKRLEVSNADIVCLQEVYSKRAEKACELLSYPYVQTGSQSSGGIYGAGLLTASKYPILSSQRLLFKHSAGIERFTANKGALLTLIDSPVGKIQVVNAHLYSSENGGSIRIKQIRELFDWLTEVSFMDVPLLLTGDFNSFEGEEDFKLLTRDFLDLHRVRYPLSPVSRSLYHVLGFTFDPRINSNAVGGSSKPGKLDLFLLSKRQKFQRRFGLKVSNAFTRPDYNNRHLSDHFAVTLDITFLRE